MVLPTGNAGQLGHTPCAITLPVPQLHTPALQVPVLVPQAVPSLFSFGAPKTQALLPRA